ncbi:hypothetical protein [Sphaerisporangium fuscum]|uniref:hypothetical protein n=1 Tax=Sphaerisporangium fuscum TaxID=2835868 RepID=UPI002029B0F5|nr:hypothetical protein [Sphaerisporangium fuscum]
MKEIIIPSVVLLLLTTMVVAGLLFYFRLLRHRTEIAAMSEYRRLAEQTLRNQERLQAQLADLTDRLSDVEQLLRSVG